MIELDVKIGAKDLYDSMLRHSYSSPAGIIGNCFGALLIVFAAMTGQGLYLVFGLIILSYLPCTLAFRSKQQVLSNPSFQQPLHYVVDHAGITISQGEDSVQYLWEDLYKVVSTGRSIIVYTSKINATIFPRKQMGDKCVSVIEMIYVHMPHKKVNIRC